MSVLLKSMAFMIRRRRLLQILWLAIPIINLGVSVAYRASHVIIVCNLSISLSALGMMVRKWLWPVALATACAVAVTAVSAERGEVGLMCLGVFDAVVAGACYWVCMRWRRAYVYAGPLIGSMGAVEAVDAFHGLRPGQRSYRQYLEDIGVPESVITCVEELCEERLTIQELVDLRNRLGRPSDDSSS